MAIKNSFSPKTPTLGKSDPLASPGLVRNDAGVLSNPTPVPTQVATTPIVNGTGNLASKPGWEGMEAALTKKGNPFEQTDPLPLVPDLSISDRPPAKPTEPAVDEGVLFKVDDLAAPLRTDPLAGPPLPPLTVIEPYNVPAPPVYARVSSLKTGPAKVEPVKVEPTKVDPPKIDPTKVDHTMIDPFQIPDAPPTIKTLIETPKEIKADKPVRSPLELQAEARETLHNYAFYKSMQEQLRRDARAMGLRLEDVAPLYDLFQQAGESCQRRLEAYTRSMTGEELHLSTYDNMSTESRHLARQALSKKDDNDPKETFEPIKKTLRKPIKEDVDDALSHLTEEGEKFKPAIKMAEDELALSLIEEDFSTSPGSDDIDDLKASSETSLTPPAPAPAPAPVKPIRIEAPEFKRPVDASFLPVTAMINLKDSLRMLDHTPLREPFAKEFLLLGAKATESLSEDAFRQNKRRELVQRVRERSDARHQLILAEIKAADAELVDIIQSDGDRKAIDRRLTERRDELQKLKEFRAELDKLSPDPLLKRPQNDNFFAGLLKDDLETSTESSSELKIFANSEGPTTTASATEDDVMSRQIKAREKLAADTAKLKQEIEDNQLRIKAEQAQHQPKHNKLKELFSGKK